MHCIAACIGILYKDKTRTRSTATIDQQPRSTCAHKTASSSPPPIRLVNTRTRRCCCNPARMCPRRSPE